MNISARTNCDQIFHSAETSYGGYSSRPRAPVVLPSASRAARGGLAVDDESIPKRPPYIAHISNLPYDVDESAITELFAGLKVKLKPIIVILQKCVLIVVVFLFCEFIHKHKLV